MSALRKALRGVRWFVSKVWLVLGHVLGFLVIGYFIAAPVLAIVVGAFYRVFTNRAFEETAVQGLAAFAVVFLVCFALVGFLLHFLEWSRGGDFFVNAAVSAFCAFGVLFIVFLLNQILPSDPKVQLPDDGPNIQRSIRKPLPPGERAPVERPRVRL